MYAAVVHSLGDIPSFEEFTGPPSNTPSGRRVVASLNPLDIALAAGELGPLETPCVAAAGLFLRYHRRPEGELVTASLRVGFLGVGGGDLAACDTRNRL